VTNRPCRVGCTGRNRSRTNAAERSVVDAERSLACIRALDALETHLLLLPARDCHGPVGPRYPPDGGAPGEIGHAGHPSPSANRGLVRHAAVIQRPDRRIGRVRFPPPPLTFSSLRSLADGVVPVAVELPCRSSNRTALRPTSVLRCE
jgi:hypothetical protein